MYSYTCKDGRVVELDWLDYEVVAWTIPEKEKIGSISFSEIEHPAGDYYLITNMYLDGPNGSCDYKWRGIGREIITMLGQHLPVAFTPHDGNKRSNGSHLTGDGPEFARRMVEAGLASFDE